MILLCIEVVYWIILLLLLGKHNGSAVGTGSFAWRYLLFYEKGIIPLSAVAEAIDPKLAERVESDFKVLYLIAALIMDYIFLFILSPRIPQIFSRTRMKG